MRRQSQSKPLGGPTIEELEAELARRRLNEEAGLEDLPSLLPIVGIDSHIVGQRLQTTAAPTPEWEFTFPLHLWDMWMCLLHLSREPLILNADGSIPARWEKPLSQSLVPVPDVGCLHVLGSRIYASLSRLQDLGLVSETALRVPRIALSPEGSRRLREGRTKFLRHLLEEKSLVRLDPSQDRILARNRDILAFASLRLGFAWEIAPGQGRNLTQRILEVLPNQKALTWMQITAAFAPAHPVPSEYVADHHTSAHSEDLLDRIPVEISKQVLRNEFLELLLVGLLTMGVTAQGEETWRLSKAGCTRLGFAHNQDAPSRHIQVTPAFDIFFAKADPSKLCELSLYAERTGQEFGMVARLTRAAFQKALALGISGNAMLASLEAMTVNSVPQNVRTTLEGWEQGSHPVVVREGVVLQCPDADTAGSLERLSKGSAERLSETLLFLPDRK